VNWKTGIRHLAKEARTIVRVVKHPGSPWPARFSAGVATAYLLSPIQLIPTIIPVIGQLDDALVIWAAMRLIRRVTPDLVFAECSGAASKQLPPGTTHPSTTVRAFESSSL